MALRIRLFGDIERSRGLMGDAKRFLSILKNAMSFNDLKQLSRTWRFEDGSSIFTQRVFGQDLIQIYTPEEVIGIEEELEFIIFLYNVFAQEEPKIMGLRFALGTNGILAPVSLSITPTRKYDSNSLIVQFNPQQKDEFLNDSWDDPEVYSNLPWKHPQTGEWLIDNIQNYGIVSMELAILKSSGGLIDEYIIPVYGTRYSYIPFSGKYELYEEEDHSYSTADSDYNPIKDPQPYALGRNNYVIDDKGKLLSYSHSVWKEFTKIAYDFYAGKYYFRWRDPENKEWVDDKEIGTDTNTGDNKSGSYERYIPIAVTARDTCILKKIDENHKREDEDNYFYLGITRIISRGIIDTCGNFPYTPALPPDSWFSETDTITTIVAKPIGHNGYLQEESFTKRLLVGELEVVKGSYSWKKEYDIFGYSDNWGDHVRLSSTYEDAPATQYFDFGIDQWGNRNDGWVIPCPISSMRYPNTESWYYYRNTFYNSTAWWPLGSVTSESSEFGSVSTYAAVTEEYPIVGAIATSLSLTAPSPIPLSRLTYSLPDPITGSCIIRSKTTEEKKGLEDIMVMDYDINNDSYIMIYKKMERDYYYEKIHGNYAPVGRPGEDNPPRGDNLPHYPDYDPSSYGSHEESWAEFFKYLKKQDKVITGQMNASSIDGPPGELPQLFAGSKYVPFKFVEQDSLESEYILRYKIPDVDVDVFEVSLGSSIESKKIEFKVTSTSSTTAGISKTPLGTTLTAMSGHEFQWRSEVDNEFSGGNIKAVSCQIRDNFMVYTYIVEKADEEDKDTWVFDKRIIGIIKIKDGYRTEFQIDPDISERSGRKVDSNTSEVLIPEKEILKGEYENFDYKNLNAIGIYGYSD